MYVCIGKHLFHGNFEAYNRCTIVSEMLLCYARTCQSDVLCPLLLCDTLMMKSDHTEVTLNCLMMLDLFVWFVCLFVCLFVCFIIRSTYEQQPASSLSLRN